VVLPGVGGVESGGVGGSVDLPEIERDLKPERTLLGKPMMNMELKECNELLVQYDFLKKGRPGTYAEERCFHPGDFGRRVEWVAQCIRNGWVLPVVQTILRHSSYFRRTSPDRKYSVVSVILTSHKRYGIKNRLIQRK
jgi:hypothetical protein